MNTIDKKVSRPRLNVIFFSVALFWSVLIVALAGWNYRQSYSATIETARSAAHDSYIKDLIYRRWAAKQGGVYVPITPETPPNPYLADVPERDISTPSGKKLTLVNPAYMTRQVHELGEKDYALRGHITSLSPIRPENAPDEWERRALQGFERGEIELSSLEPIGNETYFRLMRPLITESGCLKCHASQGYKVGDIRGGISVSVPWTPFREALRSQLLVIILAYGVIWTMGILGLYLARKRLQNYLSDRKQMEDALRESELRWRLSIENMLEAYALHEAIFNESGRMVDYRFLEFNPAAQKISNIAREEIVGRSALELYPHIVERGLMDRYANVMATGVPAVIEDFYYTGDNLDAAFDISCFRIDDRHFVCVFRDISERKRAEEENRSLQERLQRAEKMESLGTLAGGVAHDLNNVLGIIVGYSEMVLEGEDETSPNRKSLENIMNGGLKAAAIVEDLLTLARRGVQGRNILNLNKIITDCQKSPEFANLSGHHPSVKIKTDLEPDLPNISGSSVHLGKSLYNLISNASEAMPKGGGVAIKTSNQYLDRPIHGYDQIREGDYVVLSVSDTGEGISANDLKRIFEPFYTKKVMGRSGTGLGLAVVWGTVKDHNGYINVESEKGKGSAFTLYFPVTREDITAEAVAVAISEYMGKGESILVVDDVKEQRDLAASMLRTLNYNVASVSSGEAAVAYMKEHEVDLMVLDMIMDPGMDGLDTYRSVLEIHPKQKAIIVSGFSESDRVKAARDLGAGAYVRKPYIKEKLGLAVRKELDRSA